MNYIESMLGVNVCHEPRHAAERGTVLAEVTEEAFAEARVAVAIDLDASVHCLSEALAVESRTDDHHLAAGITESTDLPACAVVKAIRTIFNEIEDADHVNTSQLGYGTYLESDQVANSVSAVRRGGGRQYRIRYYESGRLATRKSEGQT